MCDGGHGPSHFGGLVHREAIAERIGSTLQSSIHRSQVSS